MTYFVGLDVSQRTAICVVDSGVGFLDFIVCCSLRIAKVFRSRRLLQRGSIDRQLSQALASCRKEPSWARVWLSSTAQWSLSPCQPFKRIWPYGAQWVANAYMLMLGALILVGGSAGDRFGRRRVFALGVAIFTAAPVACGLAPNTAALIAARAAQGGALLIPGSLAIISAAFPTDERGQAIGTWAGLSALTDPSSGASRPVSR
jgi:hypothetical protein